MIKFPLDRDTRVFAFLPQNWISSLVRQDKEAKCAFFQKLQKDKQPQIWDDMKTKFVEPLFLDGTSYKPFQLWDLEPVAASDDIVKPHQCVQEDNNGNFFYCHRVLPAGTPLMIAQNRRRGRVWFSTDIIVPILAAKCSGELRIRSSTTWMSLTPMEMLTQRKAILLAKGTVLIGGLGLGWLLSKVCAKPSVRKVIVVEKNKWIFDKIGSRLRELLPEVRNKVTDWICDDVYNHVGKHGEDTRHLLDIWPNYGGCDSRFYECKKTVKHIWGWGDYE